MKKQNYIDQLFKKGIEKEYAFDETLWADIKGKLPTQTKSLASFLTKGLSLLGSLLAIVFFSFLYVEAGSLPESSSRNIQQEKIPKNSEKAASKQAGSKVGKPIFSTKKTMESSTAGDIQEVKKEGAQNEQRSTENKPSKILNTAPIVQTKAKSLASSSNTFEKEEENIQLSSNGSQNLASDLEMDQSVLDVDPFQMEDASQSKTVLASDELAPDLASNRKGNLTNLKAMEKSKASFDLDIKSLPMLGMQEMYQQEALPEKLEDFTSVPQKKSNVFYLELQARHSIELNKNFIVDDPLYRNYKNEHEDSQYQRNFGINISKDLKKFSYGFGVHFENIKERVSIQQQYLSTEFDTSYSMVNDSYMHNGKLIYIISREIDSITQVEHSKSFQEYAEVKRLQLPLFVAYRINHKLFEIEARTAIGINYLLKGSGRYLSDDFENTIDLNDGNLKSWVISHQLQIRVAYSLSELYAVGAAADYSYELTSSMTNYENYFSSYGVSVFVRRRFSFR